jgi:tetratricopeptide (TPR) repeat protein
LPAVDSSRFLPAIRNAVDTAMAAARAKPKDAEVVGRLGMVLHAHDQLSSARECYRRAGILDPKRFEWKYYLGLTSQGKEAVQAFRDAIRLRDHLPAKLKLGEALLAAGDSEAAREVYRGLDHPAALFGYGRAANDPSYYERALTAFPQFGAAQFALAQHYQRSGRTADAKRLLADYEKFKLIAPPVPDAALDAVRALNQGPDALLREAADLERQGQLQGAAELQLKALELDPKLTQAHVNLISLYGRLNDTAGVEKHYRDAVAADPKAQDAHYNYGVFCYVAGRRKDAKTAFETTLAINSGHAGAHTNLGAMLQEQGDLTSAARHFARAVGLDPNQHLARFHLGRIYANQGRYAQAIEQLERAASADQDAAPTYLYALGAVQARAGKLAAAARTLEVARGKAASLGQAALVSAIDRDLAKLKR